MYLTYAEYKAMGGTLDEATFNDYEFEAEALVNWYTFNRLKNAATYPTELKRLMKYLINLVDLENKTIDASGNNSVAGGVGIASQSNDGVSVSYNILNADQLSETCKNKAAEAINRCLQGVKNELGHELLYRGVYPNE